jgi:hypothetical protein
MRSSRSVDWLVMRTPVRALLAVAFAVIAAGFPQPAAARTPLRIAAGSGTYVINGNDVLFKFAAAQLPRGEAVGTLKVDVPAVGFHEVTRITGLRVVGQVAFLCGVVTAANVPDYVGGPRYLMVQDVSRSGAGDLFNPGYVRTSPDPGLCELETDPSNWQPLTRGNILVCQISREKDGGGTHGCFGKRDDRGSTSGAGRRGAGAGLLNPAGAWLAP